MSSYTSETMHYTDRRVKVAQDYLAGDYQTTIAKRYGVSQGTISNDLKAIRLQWQSDYADSFNTMVAEQVAKVDKIEREAWQAWERSKQPARSATSNESDGRKTTSKTATDRDGDPRFLQQVQWCVEQRLKIVGGYAKDKRDERKLDNEEKWVTELIAALKEGRVTREEVTLLFPDLAEQFFARAGLDATAD